MNPMHARFFGEYLKDGNGTRAAEAAGYPKSSAHVAAARLLKNPKILAAIDAWRARNIAKYEITAERVRDELFKLATFDPRNLYRDGVRIPVHELDDVTAAAVAGVEDETVETHGKTDPDGNAPLIITRKQRIKMADKGPNIERLAKVLKMFTEHGEFSALLQTGKDGLAAHTNITVTLVRPD